MHVVGNGTSLTEAWKEISAFVDSVIEMVAILTFNRVMEITSLIVASVPL